MEYKANNEIYIEEEPLMTIEEVAAVLNVSSGTLYRWRKAGNHPLMNDMAIQLGPQIYRWRRADVDKWITGLLNH